MKTINIVSYILIAWASFLILISFLFYLKLESIFGINFDGFPPISMNVSTFVILPLFLFILFRIIKFSKSNFQTIILKIFIVIIQAIPALVFILLLGSKYCQGVCL